MTLGSISLQLFLDFFYVYIFTALRRFHEIISFGQLKVFSYILIFAEILLIFLITSPIILLLGHLGFWFYSVLQDVPEDKLRPINKVLQVIAIVTNIIASILIFIKDSKQRKERKLKELEEEEIKDLELADRLLKDGYYSQSILESFKVLETHLFKQLTKRNIRVARHRTNDLIKASVTAGILSESDLSILNNIRNMRNTVAHLDTTTRWNMLIWPLDLLNLL